MSFYDFTNNVESAFHAFMAGLMVWLAGLYEVRSNRESGRGRADLLLIPKDKANPGYVFEFKAIVFPDKNMKIEEQIEKELQNALNQIEEKAYDVELKAKQVVEIHKVALVFCGKDVFVKEAI